jgi:hypothetical protein
MHCPSGGQNLFSLVTRSTVPQEMHTGTGWPCSASASLIARSACG